MVIAPDNGARVFGFAMSIFFVGFLIFLLFERKIKATTFFKKIDHSFLSSEYFIDGQSWNLSHLTFYTIGGYLLVALFTWAIYSNNLPFKGIQILTYLFYVIYFIVAVGVSFLTIIFIKVTRKGKA